VSLMLAFVVVVIEVVAELFTERIQVLKRFFLVKFFFYGSVESLNLAVLRRFARVNQIMSNSELAA